MFKPTDETDNVLEKLIYDMAMKYLAEKNLMVKSIKIEWLDLSTSNETKHKPVNVEFSVETA